MEVRKEECNAHIGDGERMKARDNNNNDGKDIMVIITI